MGAWVHTILTLVKPLVIIQNLVNEELVRLLDVDVLFAAGLKPKVKIRSMGQVRWNAQCLAPFHASLMMYKEGYKERYKEDERVVSTFRREQM